MMVCRLIGAKLESNNELKPQDLIELDLILCRKSECIGNDNINKILISTVVAIVACRESSLKNNPNESLYRNASESVTLREGNLPVADGFPTNKVKLSRASIFSWFAAEQEAK